MRKIKIIKSRAKREGYYAGYYQAWGNIKAGHKRWSAFAMSEFYPKIQGKAYKAIDHDRPQYTLAQQVERARKGSKEVTDGNFRTIEELINE